MKVNEIFESIQGESSWAGLPCVFVRLTGCNLRCSYCDTKYAYEEGEKWSTEEVAKKIISFKNGIVEFTGGEPLLQIDDIIEVIKHLKKEDPERRYHFLIETNGSIDIKKFIKKAKGVQNYHFIMDIKMPSSNMYNKMRLDNLTSLLPHDEVKFVCGTDEDLDVAFKIITELNLTNALISPVFGKIEPKAIVERILKEKIRCRFQLQIHKQIWNPDKRGV